MSLSSLLKKEVNKQFIKFCLIGLESTVLYYLIFIILFHFLAINYIISAIFAYLIGVHFGFVFNKLLTFGSRKNTLKNYPKYLLANLVTLIILVFGLRFLVESIGIPPLIATIILIPLTTIINFFGIKILVFQNKKW